MDIRLIAMDLDGTALQKDRKSFSPRLEAALLEAYRRGVAIVPVTGRQYGMLPDCLKAHPEWESLVVCCNGGQILELGTGRRIWGVDISGAALEALLRIRAKYDLPMEFSSNSRLYLTQRDYQRQLPDPGLEFHRDTILANHGVFVDSLEPLCKRDVEKVNLLCIPAHLRETVAEELKAVDVSAVWSSANCMEITHPEATKGNGIRALCEILGLPMESVMALGDSGNDETMLRQAGLGVAMGNAPDHVKAWARAVTDTYDRDGAAKAIEVYVLGKKNENSAVEEAASN